jgi:hypothetical protein
MARYQLKAGCIFVDAQHEQGNRKPDDYPFPHVFNQNTHDYVAFNDTAGFIARFITLGVDTEVIPQILSSEYGAMVANPRAAVDTVYNLMKDYLKPRQHQLAGKYADPGNYQPPPPIHLGPKHTGKLTLDFSTNPIGISYIKVPTS